MPFASPSRKEPALLVEQLNELSRRELVSAAVAFPAMLVMVWAHRSIVPATNALGWLILLSALLLLRIAISRKKLASDSDVVRVTRLRNLRVLVSILYGAGWGAMMSIFDSGDLNFLFMFKIATLAAVLGVTVNALSVVLPVYIGFAIPLILMIIAHVLAVSFLQPDEQLALIIGVGVYGLLLVIAAFNVAKLTRFAIEQGFEREAANERLTILARQDALTGAFNRRHLLDELERQLQLRTRYATPFTIVILDVDHFKSINDTFGHQVGDLVLIGLTRLLKDSLREIDICGRWGGEEFLCILPNTSIPEALYCAERLRSSLASARLVEAHPELAVTASFGVGTCQPDETIDALLQRVDSLLYAAKATGRNCVKG
jgi:diguanylate cyclase (GGDEF)-like protein